MSLTTPAMALEWNTDKAMVYRSTMNGMKDKMALAATLKANVCTSLSSRYLMIAALSWRRRYHLECATTADAGGAAATAPVPAGFRTALTSLNEPSGAPGGATMAPESERVATIHNPVIRIRVFTFDRRKLRAEPREFPQG